MDMVERKTRSGRQERRRPGREEIGIDLGLGGIFKGIGDFIDLVSEMVETGESEVTRTGEFKVKGLGEKARGVYGFTVRTGIGGMPRVERFGNIRSTEEGPVVDEVREPMVDVFDEGESILVVAEVPGVAEEEITIEVKDDILTLETAGERKYAKEVLLPCPVDAASIKKAHKNGVLELRLNKSKGE
ncbi:MAG: archaeal heat shock protein Hsp20 [Chloroflexota bacterium]|nr:archaeal heat shock protein Hsp20 [Chloroflexota bacterium]